MFLAWLQTLRRYDSKNDFIYIFILAVTFLIYSSYYKMWFFHQKNNWSQQVFTLKQNQREFWNCWNIPNNLRTNDFYFAIQFYSLFRLKHEIFLLPVIFEVLRDSRKIIRNQNWISKINFHWVDRKVSEIQEQCFFY